MALMRLRGAEKLLLLALALALLAYGLRARERERKQELRQEVRVVTEELERIDSLKGFWAHKGVGRELERLRGSLEAPKVKRFELGPHKVQMSLRDLGGKELNRLLRRLGKMPLRFTRLELKREGERYRMECRCKW